MKLFSLFSVILLFALYTTSVMCTNIDDKLIQQILNDPQLSDLLHDPDKLMSMLKEKLRRRPTKSSDKCSVAVSKRNAIIRTGESRAAGAVFLSALTVDSSQACVNACCANASCNTAIMKQKNGDIGCYLFDCGSPSVCLFSSNSGFSVVQLYDRNSRHSTLSPTYLNHSKHVTKFRYSSTEFTTTTTTSVPTTRTKTKSVGNSSVAEEAFPSGACKADIDCTGDNNVVCADDGFCACRIGYHTVGPHCRQDCSRYQFECRNVDRPMLSECIAIYDACDSIAQCSDASDEMSCANQPGGSKLEPSDIERHHGNISVNSQPSLATLTTPHSSTDNNDNEETQSEGDNSFASVSSMAKKRLEGQSAAVIALSFGVVLTAILIIFAACYFRRGRKGSWKGRRFHVDGETDYLVDGMYL